MEISRSEQKRQIRAVGQLAGKLAVLPARILALAPCSAEMRRLLLETEGLSGGARQRHIKYLTKMLRREEPVEALYAFVSQHGGRELEEKKRRRGLEQWRNALVDEALERESAFEEGGEDWDECWGMEGRSAVLRELRQEMPEIDILTLSRLAFLFARTRNPRYSREIFRALRATEETRRRNIALTAVLAASEE